MNTSYPTFKPLMTSVPERSPDFSRKSNGTQILWNVWKLIHFLQLPLRTMSAIFGVGYVTKHAFNIIDTLFLGDSYVTTIGVHKYCNSVASRTIRWHSSHKQASIWSKPNTQPVINALKRLYYTLICITRNIAFLINAKLKYVIVLVFVVFIIRCLIHQSINRLTI